MFTGVDVILVESYLDLSPLVVEQKQSMPRFVLEWDDSHLRRFNKACFRMG